MKWWRNGGEMVAKWWRNGGEMVAKWWRDGGEMVAKWWWNGSEMKNESETKARRRYWKKMKYLASEPLILKSNFPIFTLQFVTAKLGLPNSSPPIRSLT